MHVHDDSIVCIQVMLFVMKLIRMNLQQNNDSSIYIITPGPCDLGA